jgi:hypothetical protein
MTMLAVSVFCKNIFTLIKTTVIYSFLTLNEEAQILYFARQAVLRLVRRRCTDMRRPHSCLDQFCKPGDTLLSGIQLSHSEPRSQGKHFQQKYVIDIKISVVSSFCRSEGGDS